MDKDSYKKDMATLQATFDLINQSKEEIHCLTLMTGLITWSMA